jgi:hypothetical protein
MPTWQDDPEMQRLLQGVVNPAPHVARGRADVATPEGQAFNRYVTQNRTSLGIPDGYEPDPTNGGQTLRKTDSFGWDDVGMAGALLGGVALGGVGLPALLGGGSSAAGAGASTVGMGAGEVALTSSALPASMVSSGVGGAVGGGNMGLGSILGWLGKGSDALGAIGNVGQVLGGAGQGSANQRMGENDQMLRQGLLRQQQANDSFSNQLRGAEFNRGEQDRQRKAAILSALLNGTQDQSMTPGNPLIAARMPQVQGGARPSNLTGNKDALLQLLAQAGPQAPTYQPTEIPELEQGGAGESILGGIGLGASILGALGRPKPQAQRAY